MRIYQTVCGIHYLRDEIETIPADRLYGFDGTWYSFGACDKCKIDLSAIELEEIIVEHGVKLKAGELPPEMQVKKPKGKVGRPAKDPTPEPLPSMPTQLSIPAKDNFCLWCDWGGSMGGLTLHMQQKHNIPSVSEAFGPVCPVCGNDGYTLLGRHSAVHGVNTVAKMFTLALAEGDVHGIVARQRAKWAKSA